MKTDRTFYGTKFDRNGADFLREVPMVEIGGINSYLTLGAETKGGVSPFGWQHDGTLPNPEPVVLIDTALAQYEIVWAAAGHPHAVFPTSFEELLRNTGARSLVVGE